MKYFSQWFAIGFFLAAVKLCSPALAQELPLDEEGGDISDAMRNKPVECYQAQSVIEQADKNGYEVFWQGSNIKDNFPDNTIAILIRPDLNAWIALELNAEAACLLGYGGNFWLFNQFYPKLEPIDEGKEDGKDQSSN